jgi:hypothetical protein
MKQGWVGGRQRTIWSAYGTSLRPNKGMKLTKLVATPGHRTEVLPRAFRRFAAVRTASQRIPGVRRIAARPMLLAAASRSGV